MKGYTVPVIGVVLLVALSAVALVNFTQASPMQPLNSPADSTGMHGMIPGLEGIPEDQIFDHFMGGQFTMTDQNGAPFTLMMTPGTVTSVVSPTITITPNGQTTTQTFNVTPSTVVHGMPAPGSVQAIVPGDKVVIITRDNSPDAIMVMKHGAMFHRRMMEPMMQ